jgi:L-lactate dehydrogenase complex protein LldG
MKVSPAKENILKKIRKALSESTPIPFPLSEGSSPIFAPPEQDLEIEFAERFTELQGKFAFCVDKDDLKDQLTMLTKSRNWQKLYFDLPDAGMLSLIGDSLMYTLHTRDLEACDASITFCESLVARTGSVVLSSAQANGRTASAYAPIHICIAFTSQLVFDIKDAITLLGHKYKNGIPSFVTFATGPSRTADIEKTLVTGVHGPKEVYVFLVDGDAL